MHAYQISKKLRMKENWDRKQKMADLERHELQKVVVLEGPVKVHRAIRLALEAALYALCDHGSVSRRPAWHISRDWEVLCLHEAHQYGMRRFIPVLRKNAISSAHTTFVASFTATHTQWPWAGPSKGNLNPAQPTCYVRDITPKS